MSKPIPDTPTQPLSFEQRLELVKSEIKARVVSHPRGQQNGIRAGYWRRWIVRHILEVA